MTSTILNDFILDAKAISLKQAVNILKLPLPKGSRAEYAGPCPVCGGKDRFSYNIFKNAWNCRGCGTGGKSAIGLAAHIFGYNLFNQQDYLAVCALLLNRPVPDKTMVETAEQKQQREEKAKINREKAELLEQQRIAQQNQYREKERYKAKEKWLNTTPLSQTIYNQYLHFRCGGEIAAFTLRLKTYESYYCNQQSIYTGPAMIAPFIAKTGAIIGCHITWINLKNPPKYRPNFKNPQNGEVLPSKKMRGSKKGGLIPLRGFKWLGQQQIFMPDQTRHRMVVGEGIETVLAMILAENDRKDTIYAAAGDLGNMAGPAEPKSRFPHPELTTQDKNGHHRPVFVAGAKPLFNQSKDENIWVPDFINELVFIADGDSERVMTAAAMVRAKTRFAKQGRKIIILWPPKGYDLADMMTMLLKPESTYQHSNIGGNNGQ